MKQGDQVPGKRHLARKLGIIFHSSEVFKIRQLFLTVWEFYVFHMIKERRFRPKVGYQNLRTIFTAARKHIFGKIVTL